MILTCVPSVRCQCEASRLSLPIGTQFLNLSNFRLSSTSSPNTVQTLSLLFGKRDVRVFADCIDNTSSHHSHRESTEKFGPTTDAGRCEHRSPSIQSMNVLSHSRWAGRNDCVLNSKYFRYASFVQGGDKTRYGGM